MPSPLIETEAVRLERNGRTILDDITLAVHEGEAITIVGPNGGGKTTLLRVLMGLEKPDRGRVRRRAGLRMGYVPQRVHVDPILPLTAWRFLTLGGNRRPEDVRAALARVGMEDYAESQVSQLSGGELQRVVLARALLRRPQVLILDEPTQGVDVGGVAELYRLIAGIRRDQGCAVLMVSHDLHVVMGATDRVICLNRHVCCTGHPHDVSRDPAYHNLFGGHVAEQIALYTHHHDHRHAPDGDLVPPLDATPPRPEASDREP